jgi:exosortase
MTAESGEKRAHTKAMTAAPKSRTARLHLAFALVVLAIAAIGWNSLRAWLQISTSGEQASDYWVVPILSALLCLQRKHEIFAPAARFTPAGVALIAAGLGINAAFLRSGANSAALLGIVVAIAGAFLFCYGGRACSQARFPLALLLLAIPLPIAAWNHVVDWLQHGSATVLEAIFTLLQISFHRNGLEFQLSSLSINIAPECSGIRSSYALLVITVLLAYLSVHSLWRRALLVAAVIPLVLIKNGIRIATISLLAVKVDPVFIDGPLHHRGGFVFFSLVFAAEGALCWLLRRSEMQAARQD